MITEFGIKYYMYNLLFQLSLEHPQIPVTILAYEIYVIFMKRREKPLSPHLGIYRPQISSVISILHRMSGVFNYIGLLTLLWVMINFQYLTGSIEDSIPYIFFSSIFGQIVVVAWSFSLIFHMCTGIRHLFWDIGWGFSVRTLTITGWAAVITSALITTICWLIAMRYITL